jgi:flagellar biosynthesis/type III secretory pathway protein FliH
MSIEKNVNADVQNANATEHGDAEQTILTEQTLIEKMKNEILETNVMGCEESKLDCCGVAYNQGYEDGSKENFHTGFSVGHEKGYYEGYDEGLTDTIRQLAQAIDDACVGDARQRDQLKYLLNYLRQSL